MGGEEGRVPAVQVGVRGPPGVEHVAADVVQGLVAVARDDGVLPHGVHAEDCVVVLRVRGGVPHVRPDGEGEHRRLAVVARHAHVEDEEVHHAVLDIAQARMEHNTAVRGHHGCSRKFGAGAQGREHRKPIP